MRYIPVNCLMPGMICGQVIKGKSGQVLLRRGTPLRERYIERLASFGIRGIYIDDLWTRDIEVTDIIPDTLRARSVYAVSQLGQDIETGQNDTSDQISTISGLVDDILDELLYKDDIQVNMLDLKVFDDYTYYHSVNVCVLSLLVATSMRWKRQELHNIGMAAILHDIGKIFVTRDIINKPESLTDDEYKVIKGHPQSGCQYLSSQYQIPQASVTAILDHHERSDGSGYPAGKKERAISPYAKIIAVADVYDALTSDRPYRKALPSAEGIEFIMGNVDTAFSRSVVTTFLEHVFPYAPGTTVRLSNGALAVVVKNHPQACLRPIVRIYWDKIKLEQPRTVDLFHDPGVLSLTIIGQADPAV